MPDPFDADRRAHGEVPTPDLWPEAQRRAADGSVVPLAVGGDPRRRPGRWLAVAAAAALAVATVAVLVVDDDQSVDTAPRAETGPTTSIVGAEGCFYGVSGDPIVLLDGPSDPPLLDPAGQPAGQTISHADLGSQVAEVHVPGLVLIDLVGERVEDVELTRGKAAVWFGAGFVQVRWFTGSQEPCDSFTVTVAGGTEDGNRHAAVDLADRILLPTEIERPTLRYTEWQLERSTVGGVPTDGDGSTFQFRQNDVLWSDGCNDRQSDFQQDFPNQLKLLGDVSSTKVACPTNPTSDAIATVMSSDPIEVATDGDLLILASGDTVLILRPIDGGGTTTSTTGDPASAQRLGTARPAGDFAAG